MELQEALEGIFETEIEAITEAEEIDEDAESPALVAREAARGILETLDDEPSYVAEAVDGFIISGERSAILIGQNGEVVARSLSDEDDDDGDLELEDLDDDDDLELEDPDDDEVGDPIEVTTSAMVGGFRQGGGRRRKKKRMGMRYEDLDEHVRLQTDYGSVSLKVDPYSLIRYPSDGEMDTDERDAMRGQVEDAVLMAVLAAKPAFETALKRSLKANDTIKRYAIKVKEDINEAVVVDEFHEVPDPEEVGQRLANVFGPQQLRTVSSVLQDALEESDGGYMQKLHDALEEVTAGAIAAGCLDNKATELIRAFDEAIEEWDAVRAGDIVKAVFEHFQLDEKLIPIPPLGKEPMPPYGTGYMMGKNKHKRGAVARVKSKIGPFATEDEDELRERVQDALTLGDWSAFDDVDELEEAGQMLGKLFQDPERYKKAMMPLQKRKLELLKAANPAEFEAMRTEEEEPDGEAVYAFSFPKARIKEFLTLANQAGADADSDVQVKNDQVNVLLPEDVATKIRPYFKGEDVLIEAVEPEPEPEPALAD